MLLDDSSYLARISTIPPVSPLLIALHFTIDHPFMPGWSIFGQRKIGLFFPPVCEVAWTDGNRSKLNGVSSLLANIDQKGRRLKLRSLKGHLLA